MAIVKQGSTTLNAGAKGDKGDAGTGGAGNPNIVVVSVEADIYDIANVDKILELQTDITLTANRTLSSNVILKDGGGSIILNGFTLTGNNTGLEIRRSKTLIKVGQTGTLAGTWDAPETLYVANFGAVADGRDHRTVFTIDKTGTGSMTSGSTTLVVSDANFDASRIGQKIIVMNANSLTDQNALITTIVSVTNPTTVVLANSANTTVSDTRVIYGTDNYNSIYQALRKVRNKVSGKLLFSNGIYMTNTIKEVTLAASQQDGFLIGDGVDEIIIEGSGTIVQTFPFDFVDADPANQKQTHLFHFYKSKKSEIRNMKLVGAYFSNIDFTEYPSGINLGTGAFYSKIVNCEISEFQGDGIVGSGDTQFEGGIQGANKINTSFDTGVSVGRILTDGTIDAAQTAYTYSTDLILINGGNYNDFSEIAGYGSFMLSGFSFAGWSGLTTQDYDAAIYDDSNTFVTYLSDLSLYEEVRIQQQNWKKIRVHFKDVVTLAEVNLVLRCDFNSQSTYIENTNVSYCGRQGASNLTSGTWWNGGDIHNNGGVSPGYGIDIEDHRRNARNMKFTNLTMWDNDAGDLAFIGTENILVQGCTFLGSTRPNWGSGSAINGSYGRSLQIKDCFFRDKSISIARGAVVDNCTFNGGQISTASAGCKISNIQMFQGQINVDGIDIDTHNQENANTILENITIRMYAEFDWILSDRNVLGQWKNINIYLNDASIVTGLVGGSSLNASFTSGQVLWQELNATGGVTYGGGSLNGFNVTGNQVANDKSLTASYARFPKFEYTNNVNVDCGISLGYYGLNATALKWENLKCKFLDIDPRSGGYGTVVPADPIANPAPIWEFVNAEIYNTTADYNMSNINFRQLDIKSFWVDVVFKNSKFVNEFVYAQTLNRSVFFSADNYGTVTFDNCTIGNKGSEGGTVGNDIVLTNTWFRDAARTYPMIFKNTELLYSTVIVPRTVDKIRYTYPSVNAPTYADNATALGALGEGYYYKDTTSGKFEVTIA